MCVLVAYFTWMAKKEEVNDPQNQEKQNKTSKVQFKLTFIVTVMFYSALEAKIVDLKCVC